MNSKRLYRSIGNILTKHTTTVREHIYITYQMSIHTNIKSLSKSFSSVCNSPFKYVWVCECICAVECESKKGLQKKRDSSDLKKECP